MVEVVQLRHVESVVDQFQNLQLVVRILLDHDIEIQQFGNQGHQHGYIFDVHGILSLNSRVLNHDQEPQ